MNWRFPEANLLSLIASTHDIVVSRTAEDGPSLQRGLRLHRLEHVRAEAGPAANAISAGTGKEPLGRLLAKVLSVKTTMKSSPGVDGRTCHFELAYPIRVGGQITGTAEYTRDITERRRTEDLLRQSQKMETQGRLAGGARLTTCCR
jgi:hypothetical protein